MTAKKLTVISAALLALSLGFTSAPSHAAWPSSSSTGQVNSLAPMLEKITPGVVSISVEGTQKSKNRIPEAFRPFLGRGGQQREQPFRGLGSGVIIDAEEGYILTNHHVVDNADKIKVSLNDGRSFDAKMIGSDPQSDVALLQIEPDNLVEVKKANSDELRVGDFTVAIGYPFGLGQTVTSGIVSALGRSGLNNQNLEDFIQTDAAINSGNSGGALVNLKGELIGINTAIIAPTGGNVGIGFAIPINMASNLVNQIIEFGEVRRGALGISGQPLTQELAESFGQKTKHGAFVSQVMEDSAAQEAGIEAGDIIIKVNGKSIKGFSDLKAKVTTMGAGSQLKITVVRDGKEKTFNVTLKKAGGADVNAAAIHPKLEGSTLSNTDDGSVKGILVTEIQRNSPAFQAGLRNDDVIIAAGRTRVKSVGELREYIKDHEDVAALRVKRGNNVLYIIIR